MLPAAFVTNEISPKIKLLPLLIIMAIPKPIITINGSIQDVVVRIKTTSTNITAMTVIFCISETVLVVATAVETALPVIALSSPMISRIASTAEIRQSSSIVTLNNALLSLK